MTGSVKRRTTRKSTTSSVSQAHEEDRAERHHKIGWRPILFRMGRPLGAEHLYSRVSMLRGVCGSLDEIRLTSGHRYLMRIKQVRLSD